MSCYVSVSSTVVRTRNGASIDNSPIFFTFCPTVCCNTEVMNNDQLNFKLTLCKKDWKRNNKIASPLKEFVELFTRTFIYFFKLPPLQRRKRIGESWAVLRNRWYSSHRIIALSANNFLARWLELTWVSLKKKAYAVSGFWGGAATSFLTTWKSLKILYYHHFKAEDIRCNHRIKQSCGFGFTESRSGSSISSESGSEYGSGSGSRVLMTKNSRKKIQLKCLKIFFWSKMQCTYVQATGEAFSPQKKTSSTSKNDIY